MMPVGDGSFYLYLHGEVRKASGTVVADRVRVEIDFNPSYRNGPQHCMPAWLRQALAGNPRAMKNWKALTPSRKKEILATSHASTRRRLVPGTSLKPCTCFPGKRPIYGSCVEERIVGGWLAQPFGDFPSRLFNWGCPTRCRFPKGGHLDCLPREGLSLKVGDTRSLHCAQQSALRLVVLRSG